MDVVLPLWLISPFVLLLLGISFLPNLCAKIWHKIENPFLIILCIFTICGLYSWIDFNPTLNKVLHVLEHEYIPFIVIIYVLYTIGTGLKITIAGEPTPIKNALFLLMGGLLSNFIGTTGASMLLIHPFLRWNRHQQYQTHLVVFFIFIVSNIGGSLTPLGDAPLFIGYLEGIPFLWPLKNLSMISFLSQFILLLIFIIIDTWKNKSFSSQDKVSFKVDIEGKRQLLLLPLVLCVLIFIDNEKTAPFLKEFLLLLIAMISYELDKRCYKFLSKKAHWAPVWEVARVFFCIFITLIPISLMLHSGSHGPFSSVLSLTNTNGVPNPVLYYWISGFFSAFLDNAPTYLLFYKMMGIEEASQVIALYNKTLVALSTATIFFGAMTYIGNAPNLMVKNIAKQHNVTIPSFLGFMGWSFVVLLPVLFLIQVIFFRV